MVAAAKHEYQVCLCSLNGAVKQCRHLARAISKRVMCPRAASPAGGYWAAAGLPGHQCFTDSLSSPLLRTRKASWNQLRSLQRRGEAAAAYTLLTADGHCQPLSAAATIWQLLPGSWMRSGAPAWPQMPGS